MENTVPVIALTAGEPAGIGPGIAVAVSQQLTGIRLVIIADASLLKDRAQRSGLPINLPIWDQQAIAGTYILPVALKQSAQPGVTNVANATYVLETLDVAVDGCTSGEFDAMVTGPVNKAIINEAGHQFTGHTEYLADRVNVDRVVMMLTGGGMRVALATTHLPLARVPSAISFESITQTLNIIDADMRQRFGLAHPRISVCGLNPHAGEDGHLGREELDILIPAIAALKQQGMNITGPLPADTAFTSKALAECDVVLAMYHDQGLPVLKHASFGKAVNVTLGLPFIRTSVDHGTALDIAGTGKANSDSLLQAIELAQQLARK